MAVATLCVVGPAPPVGAAVVVTSSGTTLTATVSGITGTVGLSCVSGQVRVLDTPATPSLACSVITSATLNGDDDRQVFGPPSPIASFPALTTTTINAAGGNDEIEGSTKREVVVGGTGDDHVTLVPIGADDNVGLGGSANDRVLIRGTTADEGIGVSTGSPTAQTWVSQPPWDAIVTTTDTLTLDGGPGEDIFVATGLTQLSTLDRLELHGGEGDDTLIAGAVRATISGGTGTNTLTGGLDTDAIFSSSPTDTVRGNGELDHINDSGDARLGGRTIDTTGTGGSPDMWYPEIRGDVALRSRNLPDGGTTVVAALGRTGRQDLDVGVGSIVYYSIIGGPADRAVLDLSALRGQDQYVIGDSLTAIDIVVPTGTWSFAPGFVTFTGPYRPISIERGGNLLVRAPYTDPELRFAHRVIRDTQMRLPTSTERNALRAALEGGTKTRAQAVLELTSTDSYRGLAVDRAFVDILRRTTDAAGRQYWIDRLEDGLVLRRLRANLYGSNEYFANAGNTPPLYVAAAYRDILGRTATTSEVDYWADQITEVGLTKGTVADRFLNTQEARTVVIRDLFLRWIDREPTSAEISSWNTQLGSSTTDGELALIRFLGTSMSYYLRPDA